MTSGEIRQSFLDFFNSKGHTIVPSSSLLPDAPNLLFTNAGMNQFVPIFLGQRPPEVDKWPGAIPGLPTRAADTQKCIRAGGKHNDLEDVGLDTYHHTFFEMLGNWSFGDYFKKEAIEWAWELIIGHWRFPVERIYATVYSPNPDQWQNTIEQAIMLAKNHLEGAKVELPTDAGGSALQWPDVEAAFHWAVHFIKAGLPPKQHIVPGNRKDNFWMMGDTGPCGPCSEIHVDLTPEGDTRGSLVNKGDARCIEIWNLVFIQFNANPDGTFLPLPAKHVDTGMGFERVTSIIQGTKGFSDFKNAKISNYETDIFRPIFDATEKLSGKRYSSTLPSGESEISNLKSQIAEDIAFRVIADHIRTLSFAIADGIQPSNEGRGYVLRRILRRAVRYGRTLGFHEPFFYKLVDVLAQTGDVFPEIRTRKQHVQETIRIEEEAFNRTLDTGIEEFFNAVIRSVQSYSTKTGLGDRMVIELSPYRGGGARAFITNVYDASRQLPKVRIDVTEAKGEDYDKVLGGRPVVSGDDAFKLYDTYGFPLDLTELMARERGLSVDTRLFEIRMEQQRTRARAAQKKEVISISDESLSGEPTIFLGYEFLQSEAIVKGIDVKEIPVESHASSRPDLVIRQPDGSVVLIECNFALDRTPLYAEMGGQVADWGVIRVSHHGQSKACCLEVFDVQKKGRVFIHRAKLMQGRPPNPGEDVYVEVDANRRRAIERHHTVTHLLHWGLHEIVSKDATQKGSYVGPEKLTFDFSSAPLTPVQIRDVEKLVNERILENAGVSWTEVPYADVKSRTDILQFFGDKYGDVVRVVQIGGQAKALDGYSMELCGGTHTRATGEIGLFRIVSEGAIAAGIRRIEAVAGLQAYEKTKAEAELIAHVATKVNSPIGELEKKIESLLAQQKELEKQLKATQQKQAAETARALAAKATEINGVRAIIENLGAADADFLQSVADALKGQFKGVIVLGGVSNGAVTLVAAVSPELTAKVQAGKIIQQIAPIVGGKGGGRPDNARGGGKDAMKIDEALLKAKSLLG